MKLFKNKFFVLIITVIFLLFSLQFYFISNSYKRDTNSYVTLVEWAGTLSLSTWKKILDLNIKEKINNWDVISTLKNSLAIIEWGDKSITRLGWNTKIKVKENFASEDLSKINISFELLKGKTWSNVISILTWDSTFTQEIKWVSAAVRGTVFEANYEEDYLLVHKHEVKLTNNNGDIKKIYPGQVFSVKYFSLDKLKIAIDQTFIEINEKMDKEYLNVLRDDFLQHMNSNNTFNFFKKFYDSDYNIYTILNSLGDKKAINEYINTLPEEKKQKILKTLETLNQSINFENWENEVLYNLKLNARWLLLDNSTDKNYNETLVRYSMYDLSDMVTLEKVNDEMTKKTFLLLDENKEAFEAIKKTLKDSNYDVLKELFNLDQWDFSVENIKNKLWELDGKWQELINQWLNKLLDLYKK